MLINTKGIEINLGLNNKCYLSARLRKGNVPSEREGAHCWRTEPSPRVLPRVWVENNAKRVSRAVKYGEIG